jgi:hexosaminidase
VITLPRAGRRRLCVFVASGLLVAAAPFALTATADAEPSTLDTLLPRPVLVQPAPGTTFQLDDRTIVSVPPRTDDVRAAADLFAGEVRPATGFRLPVTDAPDGVPDVIALRFTRDGGDIGDEGYRLDVTAHAVTIVGTTITGLRNGMQTLRQLLPAKVESETAQAGPWTVPGGHIVDRPRYAYRGAMLDVARYFFGPDVVKRYIDQLSFYKFNYLHLHLTDDQGWRIQIDSWPRLATYGGSTATAGAPGGYYTKQQYADLVEYARQRNITIVPEVDMPGHTTAALASYAELNCSGKAPPLYTGWDTGFSSLCLAKPVTTQFVDDVVRELAAMTPGPYLHIGGDEATSGTPEADYAAFMNTVAGIVAKYHKRLLGWSDALKGTPPAATTAQYWYPWPDDATAANAAANGAKLVMSPANRAYLDMKYTADIPQYGQTWAGLAEAQDAYGWDPDTAVTGVPPAAVLGMEATMFTQMTPDEKDVQFMVFPRLPELAEIAWTPKQEQSWDSVRTRLAVQAQRWDIWGLNYYHSPQIPWP